MSTSRRLTDVKWQDPWIQKRPAAGPSKTGFPKALAGAALQYSTRQAPSRGVSELLEAYRESAWLRAVVDRIAYHFAVVPWQLHQRPDPKTGKRLRTEKMQAWRGPYRHKNINAALQLGELQELERHPLLDLLNNPNTQMGGVAFRELVCKHLDFTGESLCLVVRDAFGIPYQLWPLAPTWVFRIPNMDHPFYDLSVMGYALSVPESDIIYMRRHELLNPYTRGAGIGISLADSIDMDRYAHKFLKSAYFNGTRPDMIISMPGATEDVIADFQQKFENFNRGPLRAHRTFFADAEIDVRELEQDTGLEQALPLLDHIRDTFISVFGIPPEIMGVLENANRATINQAMTIFARETLMPRLEIFADEWQRQLVPLFDDRLLLSYQNPVPEDDDFKLDVARAAPWSISNREWRRLGGWSNSDDQAEYHMVPVGMTASDDPSKPILAPGQPTPGMPTENPPEELAPIDAHARPRITKADDEDDGPVELSASEVRRIVEDAYDPDYLADELVPLWREQIQEWGNDALNELGVEARFDIQNPRVKEHLKDFAGTRIKDINVTRIDELQDALVNGVQAGEGYRELAARVKDVMATDGPRAELIARTETGRSSNFASYAAYSDSGLIERKQWIATVSDDRTRDEHLDLNGDVVGIDDEFKSGGESALYPGDFGDPAQDCNCRCTVAPVVDEPKSASDLATVWKAYDAKATRWEQKAMAKIGIAFAKNEALILRALKRRLG